MAQISFTARAALKVLFFGVQMERVERPAQELAEAHLELARLVLRRVRGAEAAGRARGAAEALAHLEQAVQAGLDDWRRIHEDADLSLLHEEPRYQALMTAR